MTGAVAGTTVRNLTRSIDCEHARFLLSKGAAAVSHSGENLFLHLLGTASILSMWEADEMLQSAGLFHSVYGTHSFTGGLLEPTADNRREVRSLIGVEAEEIVHAYAKASPYQLAVHRSAITRAVLNVVVANAAEQHFRARVHPGPSLKALLLESKECGLISGARSYLAPR